jgi:uncharacterized membrane protein
MVRRSSLTPGQRAADVMAVRVGSWGFIILLFVFMAIWMWINLTAFMHQWDPYPFIMLNFVLSCLAAVQAPIILMSQNRQTERDRLQAKYDYQVDRKAEREIQEIKQEILEIKGMLSKRRKSR